MLGFEPLSVLISGLCTDPLSISILYVHSMYNIQIPYLKYVNRSIDLKNRYVGTSQFLEKNPKA